MRRHLTGENATHTKVRGKTGTADNAPGIDARPERHKPPPRRAPRPTQPRRSGEHNKTPRGSPAPPLIHLRGSTSKQQKDGRRLGRHRLARPGRRVTRIRNSRGLLLDREVHRS